VRLPRPHIPMRTQARVVECQLLQLGICPPHPFENGKLVSWKRRRDLALRELFGEAKTHLDHDPALCNRRQIRVGGDFAGYDPPANDPLYLIWRTTDNHDIKTRVRGDGAQLSDLAITRKRKRAERKRRPKWKPKRAKQLR